MKSVRGLTLAVTRSETNWSSIRTRSTSSTTVNVSGPMARRSRASGGLTTPNVANYRVTIPRTVHALGKRYTASISRRSVGIRAATYDAALRQVTLILNTKLHPNQAIQLQIKGTSGGVTDTKGLSLNSPDVLKLGKDYLAALNLNARRQALAHALRPVLLLDTARSKIILGAPPLLRGPLQPNMWFCAESRSRSA